MVDLPVIIDFTKASLLWRANKYRPANSQSWKYYDGRHLDYKTPQKCFPAHSPRCGYVNPATAKKCNHKSYFNKTHKNELTQSGMINDVDVLDGTYCWFHKKIEHTEKEQVAQLTVDTLL